ncbi:MAG: efflux RND transporter periplasmic adaptor subunit [Hyphomicrobiaceae bacterium]
MRSIRGEVMRIAFARWAVVGLLLPACLLAWSSGPVLAQTKSVAPIRGVVRPLNQAAISIDLPIRVQRLHAREAEAFKKGDVLVTFDCERLRAEFAAAEAAAREMELSLKSQSYLDTRGAVGKLEVEISRARFDKAQAEAAGIAARLKLCTVVAPFDGRIAELKINENEVPANGQPFISLVDETSFEIDLIVTSTAIRSIEIGTKFTFTIDETGRTYSASILRIGAAVDPVSQSVKVIAGFTETDSKIIAGMSGVAVIPELEAVR